jgi:hypothetical protein
LERGLQSANGRLKPALRDLFFNQLADQAHHLARFGMTPKLFLREDQLPVHADLELASIRGKEYQGLDIRLELFEQIVYQANGPVGVMSNRAIDNLDLYHGW